MNTSSKEKVEFEKADTLTLTSLHGYFNFHRKVYTTRQGCEVMHKLYGDNRTFLAGKLGKQTFCTSDSGNRRLYVWKLPVSGGFLWILTAKERGTSYEVTNGVSWETVRSKLFEVFAIDCKIGSGTDYEKVQVHKKR